MKSFVVCFIAVLVLGCATVKIRSSLDLTSVSMPPYSGDVVVLESTPSDALEVGWITVDGSPDMPWGKMLAEAKTKASMSGANAIVFTPDNAKVGGHAAWKTLFCRAVIIHDK